MRSKIEYIDFCGFTFNGIHSSQLGLYRVSDGSRYNEDIIPSFEDKTMEKTGGDGTLFWDSFYNEKPFEINVAFDTVSEVEYREIRQVYNGKDMGYLILDELPYKKYLVKVASPPQLQSLCFMEGGQRVYKGEGTISFIAYEPFAIQEYKWLSEYYESGSEFIPKEQYHNIEEWKAQSGLILNPNGHDETNTTDVLLYNPGDLEADWKAYFKFDTTTHTITPLNIKLVEGSAIVMGTLTLSGNINRKGSDVYIGISSKTNLIEGYNSVFQRTGNLYNEYLASGDFFKIPVYKGNVLRFMVNDDQTQIHKLEYNYLFY